MSKAKAIGTKAETAVRNYLLSVGYTELQARRNVLSGSADQGDVWLEDPKHGLIVFELKGGDMAKKASYERCLEWLGEAKKEKENAGANFGFLVTQRAGIGYPRAGGWWGYAELGALCALRGCGHDYDSTVVRLTLAELVGLIRG